MYELLELTPGELNSTMLNRKYRKLSKQYHPDKNREEDTTEIYMKVIAAYKILKDPEQKTLYDLYG